MNKQLKTISAQDLGLKEIKKVHALADFSVWVRALLQNWRQGTVAVKGRADVWRTNKKPWKQKGTGRARAGSARSPLWRGGGVIFGPQPRTRQLTISGKSKKHVMSALLGQYLGAQKIVALDWALAHENPSTSQAFQALKSAGLHKQKVTVLLSPHDMLTHVSFVNIPSVNVVYFDQANAFNMSRDEYWVFLNKDFEQFKEMAARWI